MSPDRTSPTTSLPVRAGRATRADQAPASDAFATLLGAHADRADRAPTRRERQPANDDAGRERQRDRAAVDRPTDVRARREPAPATEPAKTDEPAQATNPADEAAAAAAASALLGLIAPVAPQQPTAAPTVPTAPTAEPTPAAEGPAVAAPLAAVAPQDAPIVAEPAAAQAPQPAASEVAGSKVATTETAPAVAKVQAAETAAIEDDKVEAPAEPELPTPAAPETSVAGRASVAGSGNTQAGDRRSEAVSGAGADARPSAQAPVSEALSQDAGSQQSDQRQGDAQAPRTVQPASPAPTQRVDVSPLGGVTANGVPPAGEPKGAATLSQAPRAVGQLIHLASQRGVQHARLNLKPVELGGIEIRLQTTSAGVTAQVVADSPEAARLLQQAGDDLKRSLAASNVELLSLDVSTSGEERRDASAASGSFDQFDQTGPRGNDGPGRHQRAGDADTDLSHSTQETVIELPDGVLVDVLA